MAIDGEPENGDFVRYIETLNRQAGSPGQVLAQPRRMTGRRRGAFPSIEDAPGTLGADSLSPGDTSTPPAKAAPTLAARTGQRRIALILTIAGAFALWHAVRLLLLALEYDPVEFGDFVPAGFLAICAFMLFKGGSRLRASQQRSGLPKLPPLSTLPVGSSKRQA